MEYTYERLLVSVDDGGVATLTLNRPDKKNAIDHVMDSEFQQALLALDADPEVRVIVVTGAGSAFCAGIDLSAGADVFGADAHAEHDAALGVDSDSIAERYALWARRTPIIGAINGAAVGAGFTLTLLFDLRIVADDAKLSLPFVRLGVVGDANAHWLLPRLVGVERALDLLLTGRTFTGQEAAAIGLALEAVPAAEVLERALAIAHDIVANAAPLAVGVSKLLAYEQLGEADRLAAFQRETKLIWWLGAQPDAVEGVMAKIERRAPAWNGDKHAELPEDLGLTGTNRKQQILEAAAELFHQRGYHATGIDDIGAATGITGPGVYRHFRSKDDILETLLRQAGAATLDEVQAIVEAGGAPREVLDRLVGHYVALILDHPQVTHVAIYERRLLGDKTRAWIERGERRVVDEWVHVVQMLRPELDVAEADYMVRSAMNMALSVAGFKHGQRSETLAPLLSSMVIASLVG